MLMLMLMLMLLLIVLLLLLLLLLLLRLENELLGRLRLRSFRLGRVPQRPESIYKFGETRPHLLDNDRGAKGHVHNRGHDMGRPGSLRVCHRHSDATITVDVGNKKFVLLPSVSPFGGVGRSGSCD